MKTNKLSFTISALLTSSLFPSMAGAALVAYEPFLIGGDPSLGQYTTTTSLLSQNPTTLGHSGNWDKPGFAATDVFAQTGGLNYSNGSGTLATAGGGVYTSGDNRRTGRNLSAPITHSTGATIYLSFLIKMDSVTGVYRSFELHNGGFDDGANRVFQIGHGSGGDFINGNSNYGLRLFNSGDFRIDLGAADDQVNLFVVRFDLSDASNGDSLTVWRNPTLGLEPGTSSGTLSGFDIQFDRNTISRFGPVAPSEGPYTGFDVDEIRYGTTFASVTPIPEPSTGLLMPLLALGLGLRRRR
jgi:hypothetical protein